MAAPLYRAGAAYLLYRRYVYGNDLRMCYRACDCDYGGSLDHFGKGRHPAPDTDRWYRSDRPWQHYFYQPAQKDIHEKPPDDSGIL